MSKTKGRPKNLLIESYNEIYSITPANWRRWLVAKAAGEDAQLLDFGGKCLGSVYCGVTGGGAEEAALELKNLQAEKEK